MTTCRLLIATLSLRFVIGDCVATVKSDDVEIMAYIENWNLGLDIRTLLKQRLVERRISSNINHKLKTTLALQYKSAMQEWFLHDHLKLLLK